MWISKIGRDFFLFNFYLIISSYMPLSIWILILVDKRLNILYFIVYFVHFHAFFVTLMPFYALFALILLQDIKRAFGAWRITFKVCWRTNHLCLKLIQVIQHLVERPKEIVAPTLAKRPPSLPPPPSPKHGCEILVCPHSDYIA